MSTANVYLPSTSRIVLNAEGRVIGFVGMVERFESIEHLTLGDLAEAGMAVAAFIPSGLCVSVSQVGTEYGTFSAREAFLASADREGWYSDL